MSDIVTAPIQSGLPYPLGATWDGLGVNFAVFSANATRIDLCLFDAKGRKEVRRVPLPECTDEVWHGYLPEATPGLLYGFRAYGPHAPTHGHRFNPAKLLLDPYGRQLYGGLRWGDALFGYRMGHEQGDLTLDRRDSASLMPKCVVEAPEPYAWGASRAPAVAWSDTVLYEAHVRGISQLRDDLREPLRGTAAALGDPYFIEHLLRLGVTTLELMPVHAFLQDRFLIERGLRNYWGYNTLSFFAPEPAYTPRGPNDLRRAIRQLHEAGIEVVLDVVYNHTCEGNEWGPTLSWRGLDNASYYRLIPGQERHYINDTGCGNTVNLSHPRVLQMVMDSLRVWAGSYGVDGFRFDLGVTLGREGTGFDPGSGFFDAILQDPVLSRLKLISEPWDLGPDGYQLGNHPPGFAEWNGAFRDNARRYWRGDEGQRPATADAWCGSRSLFDYRHRCPWSSINLVTAHDGFTLADLVSYAERHNEANGEDGQDGHADNLSANWGVEGPTDDPEILQRRARVVRALLAMLFLSDGTPMLLAGDEFGHTQQGNNNAYCQDGPLSWLDWSLAATPANEMLTAYIGRLSALRRAHPSVRARHYRDPAETLAPGLVRAQFFEPDGQAIEPAAWGDGERRAMALRRVADRPGQPPDVTLLLMNPGSEALSFQAAEPALRWTQELDSTAVQPPVQLPEGPIQVAAHGVMLLSAVPASGAPA